MCGDELNYNSKDNLFKWKKMQFLSTLILDITNALRVALFKLLNNGQE